MESACHVAPLYKGIPCAGTQKLGRHRTVFGPGSGNILPRAWESTGHPYPAQMHLGNVIPVIRTSGTWDSGPLTFPNACGLGICAITIFSCVGNGSRERLGHYWSPGSHPFGGSRGRPENISMATQLLCARARKSFIQWCSVPRGLHIKSLHHFLVNVCEENNSLLLRVPAQVAGWEHLFAIIAGHGKPPFAVLLRSGKCSLGVPEVFS